MLNLYYGREDKNKDKFIFDHIKGRTLLLVPDQFTLQAERDAFFYLGEKALIDVEVVSISRLGMKVLEEVGGGRRMMINQYGRHMLLAKILAEEKEDLGIYRGLDRKNSFIEMINDFISEMKQYGTAPKDLTDIMNELDDETFLKRKLTDIQRIYLRYEEYIHGKYIDTEDYISLYADKILESRRIAGASVWIYGFDAFTPKNIQVIGQLMKTAVNVNVVMTYDEDSRDDELFRLTGFMMKQLCQAAEEGKISWQKTRIDQRYLQIDKVSSILDLERELYSIPAVPSKANKGITLIRAANFYAEAESAAAKVTELVRDQKMNYKDIILICNDIDVRGSIVKRVFDQYGITLFLDRKTSILHSPACGFILSLLKISAGGYRTSDVIRLLKTGFTTLDRNKVENLENYAAAYKIRGSLWTKPFTRGAQQYTEQELAHLEESRLELVSLIDSFAGEFKIAKTVKDRVFTLYYFLRDKVCLPQQLEELIDLEEKAGYLTEATETAQVWDLLIDIFDQFIEIVGEEKILANNFADILQAGMESIEVGLLPPTADGLIMGTMQRTRSSERKAMLVLGANEGILPAAHSPESILSEDEKHFLLGKDIEICKIDELRIQEEKLAIYKNVVRPSQVLWVSYSVSDREGQEIKPSTIFDKLVSIFPNVEVGCDILHSDDPLARIQAENNTVMHLTKELRQSIDGYELLPAWKAALQWYNPEKLVKVREGLFFTNKQKKMERDFADRLYGTDKSLSVSPSQLERYSGCPFSHFVRYGMHPDEMRVFEVGGREIGDLYHTCLMELSRSLTTPGIDINDPESPWMTVSKEECADRIEATIAQESSRYREGVLASGKEELYRTRRLKEICTEMAWVLIDHVKRGKVKTIAFETAFGRGKPIAPVTVETSRGTVFIEGKIDRLDILPDNSVKIIDYKTGNEKFDLNEAKKGFRLQLLLYLKAAQQGEREPAGVFYFLIHEPSVNVEGLAEPALSEKALQAAKKSYKLDGVLVDKPEVIDSLAGDFAQYSDIVPLKKTKQGISGTGSGRLLAQEEFAELQQTVNQTVDGLCESLITGDIKIRPKKSGQISSCAYCPYKSICKFDLAFEGCRYEII